MKTLTVEALCDEAKRFSIKESTYPEPALFGVTDGKAVGTYLEHKFAEFLQKNYKFQPGNSANGVDFPDLEVDMKVTSIRQPQSSCPFRVARQKVYGLGYSLIIFVYDKKDDAVKQSSILNIKHVIFVEADRTADFQITKGLLDIVKNEGNQDDLIAFMLERNLPADDIQLSNLAREILSNPPMQGYLTVSNALQWRLQYSRVIEYAGSIQGVLEIHRQVN